MGAFLAFFDLSFCIAIPMAGAVTSGSNYQIAYLIGAASTFMSTCVAWKLIVQDKAKNEAVELIVTGSVE